MDGSGRNPTRHPCSRKRLQIHDSSISMFDIEFTGSERAHYQYEQGYVKGSTKHNAFKANEVVVTASRELSLDTPVCRLGTLE